MYLVNWFLVCLTIFLHNTEGIYGGKIKIREFHVLVHNATGKLVQSDGTLTEYYKSENWKRWIPHTRDDSFYYLKSGLSEDPRKFPSEFGYVVTLVFASQKGCAPSRADKEDFVPGKDGKDSQLWALEYGVNPIYNRCQPALQLTVKNDMTYIERQSVVEKDPENALFSLMTEEQYLALKK